ncbi:MAG: YceI family protein [Bacteroidetes bacterium]|nr:YceI family protein [Bacteroidota bacterium]
MKRIMLSAALLGGMLVSATAKPDATAWAVDKSHSNVNFTVTHMMVTEVDGKFKVYDGTILSTNDDFSDAQFNFTVDVNSVNTDDEKRDGHLKSDDFFNAEKFPQMKFKSTSFKKVSGKKYVLEGELTIRDVTKKVKFDVTYNGTGKNPWGMTVAGFKASTTINRMDYNLKWNKTLEAGGVLVSEDVVVSINMEMVKSK